MKREGGRKMEYNLKIADNNVATNDPCAICGQRTDPEVGPELFLAASSRLVCNECGRKYAPELVQALFAYREATKDNPGLWQPSVAEREAMRKEAAKRGGKRKPKKKDMLKHYATRKPKRFIQYDGFADAVEDDVTHVDRDGHALWAIETWELMYSSTVRVLIDPTARDRDVLLLLTKIRDWIVQHGVWQGLNSDELPF